MSLLYPLDRGVRVCYFYNAGNYTYALDVTRRPTTSRSHGRARSASSAYMAERVRVEDYVSRRGRNDDDDD